MLRIVSRRLQAEMGVGDLLVRWGGEEFLVLAPGLDLDATRALAHRLHGVVGSAPCAIDGRAPLAITISIGWSAGCLGDVDELISIADRSLYEAKHSGRDRVVGDGWQSDPTETSF